MEVEQRERRAEKRASASLLRVLSFSLTQTHRHKNLPGVLYELNPPLYAKRESIQVIRLLVRKAEKKKETFCVRWLLMYVEAAMPRIE
jgi:hypothetical protein